ncbi:hypothetical protein TIFTF001_053382 [Ficus carica]|uniref:Uncharacterized protein n=1 Tax=Ficus carica TaxID=3494 RepID=A0AA88EBJ5_FICCA|nr:hypothetical protein TIFTF001_053382 [Ficus carica]
MPLSFHRHGCQVKNTDRRPIIVAVLVAGVISSLSPSLSMSLPSLAGAIPSLDVAVALAGLSLTTASRDGERLEAKSSSDDKNGWRSVDGRPFPVPVSLSPFPLPLPFPLPNLPPQNF